MRLMENRMRQVMVINNLMDSNCPRLNSNAAVVRCRFREYWPGVTKMKVYPRIPPKKTKMKQLHRLSGFFQAQLRMMKHKKKGKLIASSSSNKSSLISKKLTSNSFQLRTLEKCKTGLISYQFTTNSSSLKRHQLKKNRLSDLPKELLAEILVRLPVKYILRCTCVLKSWNYFIRSPMFVTLQLNYQKQITTANHYHHYPKYLLFQNQNKFGLTLRFDDIQCEEYCTLEFLPNFPGHAWFALSYGLICTSTIFLTHYNDAYNRNIYLWNPLIKKYKTLPNSPLPSIQNLEAWEALAFGFLPEDNDYVVIHIIKPCLPPHPHSVIIGVYSLNTNSWKKSSQDNVFISKISSNHDNVVFINGAAFWVGFYSNQQKILLCFDTKTDILCEISLPDSVVSRPQPHVPVIHAFGQSIAYFIWEDEVIHFDMWVLKYDYINEFTWEKKMCVTPSEDVEEEVVGVRNNGDPIVAKFKHLISYNIDSHQANWFVTSWDRWTPGSPYRYGSPYVIRPFVESLVMLNND